MKRLILATLMVAFMYGYASAASSVTINSKGTSGAPVSITTAATVLAADTARTQWTIEPEADIRCEVGDANGNAPANTPTATVGFLMKANTSYNEHSFLPNTTLNAEARVDCAAVTGTVSVNTWEER